jgi:hypothetical protein
MCVDGIWYIREDALPVQSVPPQLEPCVTLASLCKEYGIDKHRAYRAVKAEALDASPPRGCVRPLKCRRSEFIRWMNADLME